MHNVWRNAREASNAVPVRLGKVGLVFVVVQLVPRGVGV